MAKMSNGVGMIGMAMKAGKVVTGTELVGEAIRKHKVCGVLVAKNASQNTVKRVKHCCEYYKIDLLEGDMNTTDLGEAIGKFSPVASIAITDEGFKKEIWSIINAWRMKNEFK